MLLTLHRNEVFSEVIKFRRMGMWTDKRAWLHLRCAVNCIKLKSVTCSFVTSKIYKATVFPASVFWQAAELVLLTAVTRCSKVQSFLTSAVVISGSVYHLAKNSCPFMQLSAYIPLVMFADPYYWQSFTGLSSFFPVATFSFKLTNVIMGPPPTSPSRCSFT